VVVSSDHLCCSVIIPAKNAAHVLGLCLDAVNCQSLPRESYEVIVVDDGSTDGTSKIAAEKGARVLSQPPSGPAAARNAGAKQAASPLLVFTDADCEPVGNWLEMMLAPFALPTVAGVKGAYLSRQQELTARFVQLEYEDKYLRMMRYSEIDFVDTYSAAFRKAAFWSVQGYDTGYPNASVEDQEFSFRMAKTGHQMVFVPGARVYHRHAHSAANYARKKYKIGYWKVRLLKRHPDKVINDTHTPQILKAQIVLFYAAMALTLAAAVAAPAPLLVSAAGAAWAAFALTTVPLAQRAAHASLRLAAATPLFLALRSAALGAGMAAGFVGLIRSGKQKR